MNPNIITSVDIHPANQDMDLPALLRRLNQQILQSLELDHILSVTAAEIRAFLKVDRVKIYQFHPDGSGQVVAESIRENILPSLLGLNFPADDIPPESRELFVRTRPRVIVDVSTQCKAISSAPISHNPDDLTATAMQFMPADPCHLEYLTTMGVQSSLVMPILHQQQLWGLVAVHHTEPWLASEPQLLGIETVVDQLAIAIAQADLLRQAREKSDRKAAVNRLSIALKSLPNLDLQAALEIAVTELQGSGGRLYLNTHFEGSDQVRGDHIQTLYTYGTQPVVPKGFAFQHIEQSSVWQRFLAAESGVWAVSDLYSRPELRNFQSAFQTTPIRGWFVVPLHADQQCLGYLSVFRDEINTETLWAGQFDPDQRQTQPRLSFDVWKQSQKGQAHGWTEHETQLGKQLGLQFKTALQQYILYHQVKLLNATLESQVLERTQKLSHAAEQQQALFEVVTQIRNSLDVEHIFQTATQEIRELLAVDRVVIYQFHPDWSGEFVAEAVTSDWLPILSAHNAHPNISQDIDDCSQADLPRRLDDSLLRETQGGAFARGDLFRVCPDIYQANLSECHIELLETYQVKAYAIAAIYQGQTLWGLLAAYQNTGPRQWEEADVQFLAQIAAQVGVAIQQATLLGRTQQQAQQLARTVKDLQRTQTQLIQTEKMSSLGQLVAGIAHEINNPINFIYGNLPHAHNYAEDILSLLRLYQEAYPKGDPQVIARAREIDVDFIAADLPKILSSMKAGAERIRQVILSLLHFSHLDQAEHKAVDIHKGIDSTLLILQNRLREKLDRPAIEVCKDYGDLPKVDCYAGLLNQVIMNILNNAIDALELLAEEKYLRSTDQLAPYPQVKNSSPLELRISIQTAVVNQQWVEIAIADNGLGIPDAVKAHIFDPFFTTKPVGKGTGMGLSVSYQIVTKQHGGSLRCLSVPGEGTKFVIRIPLQLTPKSLDDTDLG